MPRRWTLPPLPSIVLATLTLAWSVLVIDEKLVGATLPGPGTLQRVLPYLMPALLVALLLIRRPTTWLDEATWVWTVLVLLAAVLVPKVVAGSVTPFALPGVALAAAVVSRWPAATLALIAFFSAALGSLHAFFNFPSEKAIALCLVGLLVASLVGALLRGSRPIRLSVSLSLLVIYILLTAGMMVLAPSLHVAYLGFKDSTWFMVLVPVIAWAGWRDRVHDRAAKALLLVVLATSLYTIYRVIAGPAPQEYAIFASSAFNFTGATLKPGGSFNTAQDMGTWMAAVVPFCFAQMLYRRGAWQLVAAVALGLAVVSAIESQTRIALVGIVAGIAVVLALYERSNGFPGLRLNVTVLATVVGIALVAGGLSIAGNRSTHSFTGLLHPTSDASYRARTYKWSRALNALDTHPFGFGVGTASAGESTASLYFALGDTSIDNGYLRIALEQGLVIMVLFIAAALGMLVALCRAAIGEHRPRDSTLAIGAAGTLTSFLLVMLAEDASATPRAVPVWLIVGLGMAVAVRARQPSTATETAPPA